MVGQKNFVTTNTNARSNKLTSEVFFFCGLFRFNEYDFPLNFYFIFPEVSSNGICEYWLVVHENKKPWEMSTVRWLRLHLIL